MFKVDNRLQRIAEVIGNMTFADVGTDHGKLSVMKANEVKKIIATDIKEKCLEKAQKAISENGFEGIIETRLGNGLDPIKYDEVECIVVAGIGGDNISEIISNSKKFNCYVLSPNTHSEIVRTKLIEMGYKIELDEMLLFNRKWYPIIKAVKGNEELSDLQIKYGKFYNQNPSSIEFLKYKLSLLKQIKKNSLSQAIDELENIIKQC